MIQHSVIDFYNKLKDYGYFSCGYDGHKHFPQNSMEWDKWNIVMNPDLFHQMKGGCCWDYCIAQEKFFKDNHIPCWSYNILCEQTPFEVENNCTPTTHTFTIFRGDDNKYYYFEQSFKKHPGIYGPHETLNEALLWTLKWLMKMNPNHVRTLELHKHNPLCTNTYGNDSYAYYNYMKQEPLLWQDGEKPEILLTAVL
ncbi:MAG: hypothetical protein MJZ34_02285 [Paludibacteraceae bacterium]|nr:hypothetical protein [Paludibacteraceae bacterium]